MQAPLALNLVRARVVIEAADVDAPLWQGIASQDVTSERGNVVRELVKPLSRLLEHLQIFLAQCRLCHGCAQTRFGFV
jgi:hypothetical protein